MAESAHGARRPLPRIRAFGTAAQTASQRFAWLWTRESLLRLLLSLILSLALWLYITGQQNPARVWAYPYPIAVTAQNVAAGLTVTNSLTQVHVEIRANRNITPVLPTSFHAYVDLLGYRRGVYNVRVAVLPDPGIEIASVSPSKIRVVLDTLRSKTVPVHPSIYSDLPSGYAAGTIQMHPGSVTVSGPSSEVAQVQQAVAYISLGGVKTSLKGTYKPVAETAQGATVSGQISISPSEVQVIVPVTALSSFKTVPVLATIQGTPQPGYRVVTVSIEPQEVVANGPPSVLNKITSVSTVPISDAGKGAGTFSISSDLQLPKNVTANVSKVRVTVQIQPILSSSSLQIGVSPVHLSEGMTARLQPGQVLITVLGPANALDTAAQAIRATVDVRGLKAGNYTLPLELQNSSGLKVLGISPRSINVRIVRVRG